MLQTFKDGIGRLYKKDGVELQNGRGMLEVWYSEGRIREMAVHGKTMDYSLPVLLNLVVGKIVGDVRIQNNGIRTGGPDLVAKFDMPDSFRQAEQYISSVKDAMDDLKEKKVGVGMYTLRDTAA